jgi:hypothetical protein
MSAPRFLDYYRSLAGRRFLRGQTAALGVAAIGLLVVFGSSDLDGTGSSMTSWVRFRSPTTGSSRACCTTPFGR